MIIFWYLLDDDSRDILIFWQSKIRKRSPSRFPLRVPILLLGLWIQALLNEAIHADERIFWIIFIANGDQRIVAVVKRASTTTYAEALCIIIEASSHWKVHLWY